MALKRGIYRNLPDDVREEYDALRREVRRQEQNRAELDELQDRYGPSTDIDKVRGKIEEAEKSAVRAVRLAEIRINTDFARLETAPKRPK